MIALGSTLTSTREAGVVYTKPWMVELVLELAGTLPEKRLADLVALEPSAGHFNVSPMSAHACNPYPNSAHCTHRWNDFQGRIHRQ
jgi:hypothetical protein